MIFDAEVMGGGVPPNMSVSMPEQDPSVSLLTPEEEAHAMEEAAKKAEEERQKILTDLAAAVEKKFDLRRAKRRPKESEWVEAYKLYLGHLGTYDNYTSFEQPFGNKRKKRRPDHNIVRGKCDVAVSQNISIQFAGGDKNWDLHPTASPDIPAIEAAAKAELMEKEIEDQLTEARYGFKCRKAITDRVILGTGILKGPVNTPRVKKIYLQSQDPMTGRTVWMPSFTTDVQPDVQRVDPWMFYPDDTVNDFERASDCIEAHPKSRTDLVKLRANTGFIQEVIDELMEEAPKEYSNNSFSDYASLTDTNPDLFKDKYVLLEYHGPITRTQLDALEIDPGFDSPIEEYYGEVWVCQGRVLRIELSNIEGDFELPYSVCPWVVDPSSVFGFGVPIVLQDQQRVVTSSWHMVLDNASASSAPMLFVDKAMIEPANGEWVIGPGKIYYQTEYGGDMSKAMQYIITPNNSEQLMNVLMAAKNFSEEESSIPLMAAGLQSPQATQSATGMAILQQASTTVLDYMAEVWDDLVTNKTITRFYHWNMQYGLNDEAKGDFEIDVRSSSEFRNKQLYLHDLEKISMESAQNPAMAEVLNMQEVTRARLSMMRLPNRPLVKTDEQIAQEQEQKAQQPDPAMIEMQMKQKELELKEREIGIKEGQLEIEYTLQQQREQMDHAEKMANAYARIMGEQAAVLRVQTEKEIEMLKLAQRETDSSRKHEIMAAIALQSDETKKFLAAMQAEQNAIDGVLRGQDIAATHRELAYAEKHGKGI